jgi:hypothetical protein
MRYRIPLLATSLTLALPATLGAATPQAISQGPQPIYAAFSLLKQGKGRTQRCGEYTVSTATYAGTAISPDRRMAGNATFSSRIAALKGKPTGVATGTLTIRNGGRLGLRASLTGVMTQGIVVNGIAAGTLYTPNQRLMANLSIVFDDRQSVAVFRLGLESGANTAIAYPPVPRCGR